MTDQPGEDLAALEELLPVTGDTEQVANLLYAQWYLSAQPPRPRSGAPAAVEVDAPAALDAAHAADLSFEPGWMALRASTTGRVDAAKGNERRLLSLGEYVDLDHPGQKARPGHRLLVTSRRSAVEDGFWVTRSAGWPETSAQPVTRLYVNVCLQGATLAVARTTGVLERWGGDYAMKVFLGLDALQRADALVICVPRIMYLEGLGSDLVSTLSELHDAGVLEPRTPRLTGRLMPGVAAVDGPADGASYGVRLCRQVAAALLAAESHDPAAAIADWFRRQNLDPERPYLEAGATYAYAVS